VSARFVVGGVTIWKANEEVLVVDELPAASTYVPLPRKCDFKVAAQAAVAAEVRVGRPI